MFEQRLATALNLPLLSHSWRDNVFLWIELAIPFLADDTLVATVTSGLGPCHINCYQGVAEGVALGVGPYSKITIALAKRAI